MKYLLPLLLLAACGPGRVYEHRLDLTVDTRSTTEERFAKWRQAADRIEAAAVGININLAPGECAAGSPGCVASVQQYANCNLLGEGYVGSASILDSVPPDRELDVMTHELLHALGAHHTDAVSASTGLPTIMSADYDGPDQPICNDATLQICGFHACETVNLECEVAPEWIILKN